RPPPPAEPERGQRFLVMSGVVPDDAGVRLPRYVIVTILTWKTQRKGRDTMQAPARWLHLRWATGAVALFFTLWVPLAARPVPSVDRVELQPLAAHVRRVIQTLDYLGAPLRAED